VPVSRLELRTRAKRRADMESSSFVSDEEWNDYLNEGISQLHGIVTLKNDDFIVKDTTISLSNGVDAYRLPDDFLRERGVDLVEGSNTYTLDPFMFRERNRLQYYAGGITRSDVVYMYQIIGDFIRFIPDPTGTGTIKLWYIPQAQILDRDKDKLDVAYANGWDRYVIIYAAIEALRKEESDVTMLEAKLNDAGKRIMDSAVRSAGDPKRVVDVRYKRETFWR
jgi:hypothetical protein